MYADISVDSGWNNGSQDTLENGEKPHNIIPA